MSLRTILVTGANGLLGQAIAQSFLLEDPANFLWLGVHTHADRATELAGKYPGRCRTLALDVAVRESWQQAVSQVMAEGARLDVLVNNAGTHEDTLLGMMSQAAWDKVRATNLDGVFHGCQAVLPVMIAQRFGRIVNVSSLSALMCPAGQANYAAAKAGVLAFTQSLAKEVARLNITVNAVCPGFIETEALKGMTQEERTEAQRRIPMRRFGRPGEVAAAVQFLASPHASYITGSMIKIDGGIL